MYQPNRCFEGNRLNVGPAAGTTGRVSPDTSSRIDVTVARSQGDTAIDPSLLVPFLSGHQHGERKTSPSNRRGSPASSRAYLSASGQSLLQTFVFKLFEMVNESPGRLIAWNVQGTSFLVRNTAQFSREVLPKFYRHSNFSSFIRQLNMYGFHKINRTPRGKTKWPGARDEVEWEFSHPRFQRDRPDWLPEIRRRKAMDATGDGHAPAPASGGVGGHATGLDTRWHDGTRWDDEAMPHAPSHEQWAALSAQLARVTKTLEAQQKQMDAQQAVIHTLVAFLSISNPEFQSVTGDTLTRHMADMQHTDGAQSTFNLSGATTPVGPGTWPGVTAEVLSASMQKSLTISHGSLSHIPLPTPTSPLHPAAGGTPHAPSAGELTAPGPGAFGTSSVDTGIVAPASPIPLALYSPTPVQSQAPALRSVSSMASSVWSGREGSMPDIHITQPLPAGSAEAVQGPPGNAMMMQQLLLQQQHPMTAVSPGMPMENGPLQTDTIDVTIHQGGFIDFEL